MFSMSLPLPRVRTWDVFSWRDYTPQLNSYAVRDGLIACVRARRCPSRSLVTCVHGHRTPLTDEPSLVGRRRAPLTARLARPTHSWDEAESRAHRNIPRPPRELGHQSFEQASQSA